MKLQLCIWIIIRKEGLSFIDSIALIHFSDRYNEQKLSESLHIKREIVICKKEKKIYNDFHNYISWA